MTPTRTTDGTLGPDKTYAVDEAVAAGSDSLAWFNDNVIYVGHSPDGRECWFMRDFSPTGIWRTIRPSMSHMSHVSWDKNRVFPNLLKPDDFVSVAPGPVGGNNNRWEAHFSSATNHWTAEHTGNGTNEAATWTDRGAHNGYYARMTTDAINGHLLLYNPSNRTIRCHSLSNWVMGSSTDLVVPSIGGVSYSIKDPLAIDATGQHIFYMTRDGRHWWHWKMGTAFNLTTAALQSSGSGDFALTQANSEYGVALDGSWLYMMGAEGTTSVGPFALWDIQAPGDPALNETSVLTPRTVA